MPGALQVACAKFGQAWSGCIKQPSGSQHADAHSRWLPPVRCPQAIEEARDAAKLCVLRFLAEVRTCPLGWTALLARRQESGRKNIRPSI